MTTCGQTDLMYWTNIIIWINKSKNERIWSQPVVKRVFLGLQEEMTHVDKREQVAERTDSLAVAGGNNSYKLGSWVLEKGSSKRLIEMTKDLGTRIKGTEDCSLTPTSSRVSSGSSLMTAGDIFEMWQAHQFMTKDWLDCSDIFLPWDFPSQGKIYTVALALAFGTRE